MLKCTPISSLKTSTRKSCTSLQRKQSINPLSKPLIFQNPSISIHIRYQRRIGQLLLSIIESTISGWILARSALSFSFELITSYSRRNKCLVSDDRILTWKRGAHTVVPAPSSPATQQRNHRQKLSYLVQKCCFGDSDGHPRRTRP